MDRGDDFVNVKDKFRALTTPRKVEVEQAEKYSQKSGIRRIMKKIMRASKME